MSAPANDRPYVFISYASVNRDRVVEIVDVLASQGVAAWFDVSDIPGGTSYGPEIVAGIKNATAIVLMCSEASLASRNVRQEIQLAWRHERPILPLLLEPLIFPDDVSYWLEGAQWIEVLDRAPDAWLDQARRALMLMGYGGLAPSTDAAPSTLTIELPPNNLPEASHPLVGRERELRHISSLLEHSRNITLTGTGGSGKTRLAEQVARENAIRFPDGIWFVDGAQAQNADDLVTTIATTLGIQENPAETLADTVAGSLRDKPTLLLLDNLEQIADAANAINTIVTTPGPVVLVTSRTPTRATGEIVVPVTPLQLPSLDPETPASTIGRNAAVQLFVDRARQVKPDFQLSDGNAHEIATICARLDGLPLAIELAAARSRLLHPAAILQRLDSRLSLQSRGSARSARQQTLYATIAWSYDLLDPAVQTVFRRFGVFVRGADVETAEQVIAGIDAQVNDAEILDAIDELIDHSLLEIDRSHNDPDSTRVRMLETIREFALATLEESGEAEATRAVHAAQFRAQSDVWIRDLESGNQAIALNAIAGEQGNILAAVDQYLHSPDKSDLEAGLQFTASLWRYWWMKGAFSEGNRLIDVALARCPDGSTPARAAALNASGIMVFSLGRIDDARQLHTEAAELSKELDLGDELARSLDSLGIVEIVAGNVGLSIDYFNAALEQYRRSGNQQGVANTLSNLIASNTSAGNFAIAEELAMESLATWRAIGDQLAISQALLQLGVTELFSRRYVEAHDHFEQALTIAESLGDRANQANALANLGSATEMLGDLERAKALFDDANRIYQELEDLSRVAYLGYMRGHVARAAGETEEAKTLLVDALEVLAAQGMRDAVALCLESLAGVLADSGDAESGARFLGSAALIREESGIPLPENRADEVAADTSAAVAILGQERFDQLAEEGRSLDPLQFALDLRASLKPANA